MSIDVVVVLLGVLVAALLWIGYRRIAEGAGSTTATGALLLALAVIVGFGFVLGLASLPVW